MCVGSAVIHSFNELVALELALDALIFLAPEQCQEVWLTDDDIGASVLFGSLAFWQYDRA